MLDSKIIRKIEEFVYKKPRSVQEISELIQKNWRTADRYINEIEKNYGTISTKTFRGGTRGALKIVYWSSIEKISKSIFQEKLEQDIFKSRRKDEFSSFDIFQHVEDKNKTSEIVDNENNIKEFSDMLLSAENQLLFFSGNLSFINTGNKEDSIFKTFEELVKRGVDMKILCRVDLAGKENIEKVLSLNHKYGKELIEIRHDEHPLRGVVIDNKLIRLKEVKEPIGKINELNKKVFIYYNIKDKDWSEWFTKIFWKKYSNSIDSHKRLIELNKIRI